MPLRSTSVPRDAPELQPKLSEVGEDQPHSSLSNVATFVQLIDVSRRDHHSIPLTADELVSLQRISRVIDPKRPSFA